MAAPQDVEKARKLMDAGDYDGAAKEFLSAVKSKPKDIEARRGAAEALLGLGRTEEAINQAYEGLELTDNKDAGLWLIAARAYMLVADTLPATDPEGIRANFADARAKAAQALKVDPELNAARPVLAKALANLGETDAAEQVLATAREKNPKDFDVLFESGMLAMKKKSYTDAVGFLTGATLADPESGEALFRLGFAQLWISKYDEALENFTKAAILDPWNKQSLQYIGKYGKNRAPEFFQKIVDERPDHAWAHAYIGWYAAYAKKGDKATSELRTAVSLAPENASIRAWQGEVYRLLGKINEAVPHYKKALTMNAGEDLAWNQLLAFATAPDSIASNKDRDAMIKFLGGVRPNDPWLWNNAGLLYRDSRQYKKSLQCYIKAAEFAPNDQGIVNDTGLIYLYHGKQIGEDPKKALPYFERVLIMIEEDRQPAKMGYRDTLENLAYYYQTVEKDPELALKYATHRNDPAFYGKLDRSLASPSMRAAGIKQWAEQQLKK
jgi:tetratricopeptide (TPR) repeat protein